MLGLTLYFFGLFVVGSTVLLAGVNDARAFKIPNYLSVLAIIGFIASYIGVLSLPGNGLVVMHVWWMHVFSAVVMFFITLILFGIRAIGAGDAKFASALAVWFGAAQGLPLFIFYTSLFGGILGILTILLRKYKPFVSPPPGTWVASAQSGLNRVPYGIAISVGFLTTAHTLGYFNFDVLFTRFENGG